MNELKSKTQLKTLEHIIDLINRSIKPEQKRIALDTLLTLLNTEVLKYQALYAEDLFKIAKKTLKKEQKAITKKPKINNAMPRVNKRKTYVNQNDGWTDCSKLSKQTLVLKPKNSL
jgi:predicted membrane-bound dolichyl-phosphate-mannose-protein mannosyltransferase